MQKLRLLHVSSAWKQANSGYLPKSVYPFVFVKYSENLSGVSGACGASRVRKRMKVKNEGEASFLCIF
jgi:hypothetical protein